MEIITKTIPNQDRQAALKVEAGAMPHNQYLDDVWELFYEGTDGDLIGAYIDGENLQGIGKLTRLYGDIGWLETLRVHPDYQGRGLGKALYRQYFENMDKMGLTHVGMYTEMYNVVSKGLAESFGFAVEAQYTELLRGVKPGESHAAKGWRAVDGKEGEDLLAPYYEEMAPYTVVNRTFFPAQPGLGEHLAQQGWVYTDDQDNLLVAGYRFQPENAFHIPFIQGDKKKALTFANHLAEQSGSKNLSILKPENHKEIKEFLRLGFGEDDDYMTLWIERK